METIAFEFTARRYHATPWGAHVNEGRVEWPPCPWRLLRTLISVGYNKLNWDVPPPMATSLLEKLAAVAPEFCLPSAIESHTRHYMPSREGSNEKKVKIFDAFLRLERAEERLLVRYPVVLSDEERTLLSELAEGISYLGRAESWVEAELLSGESRQDDRVWLGLASDQDTERTRLLSSLAPDEYAIWRAEAASAAADSARALATQAAKAKDKKVTAAVLKKAQAKAEQKYPPALLDALQLDTSTWQAAGWSRPPGSRWVDYQAPLGSIKRRPLAPTLPRRSAEAPQAILLAIDGEGKRGTLRPRMPRCLPLMEALHAAAISHMSKQGYANEIQLTGTDSGGKRAGGAHRHAHWLPLSLMKQAAAANDSIDHVLVCLPSDGGFSEAAVRSISAVGWIYSKGLSNLSVSTVGQGGVDEIARQLNRLPAVNANCLSMLSTSKHWQSATPLVLRKFLHTRGKKTVVGQIREELAERGFPSPTRIRIESNRWMVEQGLKGFVLRRQPKKNQPPFAQSWGIGIEFDQPVSGPITLGYASHFGLGMFRAV